MAARIGKGFKVSADGKKVKKSIRHLDSSAQIRQRTSKKVRVARKGSTK